jgi:protein ImuB
MSGSLYACAYAAEFPAQALLRLRPEVAREAAVVLDGRPPQQVVCSLNRKAQQAGAVTGMTRLEAETIGTVKMLARSVETEAASRAVFLECAAQFSPRIQEASQDTACAFVLDIAGTERLFGDPQQLACRLRDALAAVGLRAAIAVSANYHVAQMKAAAMRGGIAVVPEGKEAAAVAALPVSALGVAAEFEETFALWGIRTLGELAALPVTDLVARMGPGAQRWHALTCGAAEHAFQPIEPAFVLEEFCAFETPLEQLDSLLFMGARMIECLATRAATRALLLAALTVRMKLEDGTLHERRVRPAVPTGDRKFLLKLLQLEVGSHPPPAAVVALTLSAEAGLAGKVQLGLFAPQTPEPSRLDVTLARLKALVGDGRVGAATLEDTHRPGSFRVEEFSVAEEVEKAARRSWSPEEPVTTAVRMALRRVRPPVAVRMMLRGRQPAAFREGENRFEVTAAYGPWRSSGCWWSADAWDTEEWDVLATRADGTSMACLLACTRNVWRLEAFYD